MQNFVDYPLLLDFEDRSRFFGRVVLGGVLYGEVILLGLVSFALDLRLVPLLGDARQELRAHLLAVAKVNGDPVFPLVLSVQILFFILLQISGFLLFDQRAGLEWLVVSAFLDGGVVELFGLPQVVEVSLLLVHHLLLHQRDLGGLESVSHVEAHFEQPDNRVVVSHGGRGVVDDPSHRAEHQGIEPLGELDVFPQGRHVQEEGVSKELVQNALPLVQEHQWRVGYGLVLLPSQLQLHQGPPPGLDLLDDHHSQQSQMAQDAAVLLQLRLPLDELAVVAPSRQGDLQFFDAVAAGTYQPHNVLVV